MCVKVCPKFCVATGWNKEILPAMSLEIIQQLVFNGTTEIKNLNHERKTVRVGRVYEESWQKYEIKHIQLC